LEIPRNVDPEKQVAESAGVSFSDYLRTIYEAYKTDKIPAPPSARLQELKKKFKKKSADNDFLYFPELESSESYSDPERVFAIIDTSSSSLGSLESFSDSESESLSLVDCDSESESIDDESDDSDSKGKSILLPSMRKNKANNAKRIPSASRSPPASRSPSTKKKGKNRKLKIK